MFKQCSASCGKFTYRATAYEYVCASFEEELEPRTQPTGRQQKSREFLKPRRWWWSCCYCYYDCGISIANVFMLTIKPYFDGQNIPNSDSWILINEWVFCSRIFWLATTISHTWLLASSIASKSFSNVKYHDLLYPLYLVLISQEIFWQIDQ